MQMKYAANLSLRFWVWERHRVIHMGTSALACGTDTIGILQRICRTGQYDGVGLSVNISAYVT